MQAEEKDTVFHLPFGSTRVIHGISLMDVVATFGKKKVFVVTDALLASLFASELEGLHTVIVQRGEAAKTLETISTVSERLIQLGADRSSCLVAFGGGAICDFTGFLASVFMRGISFSSVPTTLLAQVDAAFGGKTAVNLSTYKNMLGSFSAPHVIGVNPSFTQTQDLSDWVCGLAETVKHAVVADSDFLNWLEDNCQHIMGRKLSVVEELVRKASHIKMQIVSSDPFEENSRKLLNFGHTVGHALELTHSLPHGFAVALGMAAELELSTTLAGLSMRDKQRIIALLKAFNLPVDWRHYPLREWFSAVSADKKRAGRSIDICILKMPGSAHLQRIAIDEIYGHFG